VNGFVSNLPPDPVQAMLAQTELKRTLFAPDSRYYGLDTATIQQHGATIVYLTRRFLPAASRFQLIQEHTVTQGERLDNVTAHYLGSPTLFWRVCDANNAMRPDDLTATIGRRLRITMPEGITGTPI
jgi:hypothetical protein